MASADKLYAIESDLDVVSALADGVRRHLRRANEQPEELAHERWAPLADRLT